MSKDELLVRCQYTWTMSGTSQKKQCPARTLRADIKYCPEHRCVYRDSGDIQCENGIHHKMQCSSHQCREESCTLKAHAPSSYCQVEHVRDSCRYEDEFGSRCPKDPVGTSDYCSKRHRFKARQVRKQLDNAPASHEVMIASWEKDTEVDSRCTCTTSYGLAIHHYNGACPDHRYKESANAV